MGCGIVRGLTPSACRALGLAAVAVLALSGCNPYVVNPSVAPPLKPPERYSEAAAELEAAQPGPDRWWEAFGNKELTRAVGQALSGNFDIRGAWARVKAAEATARIVGTALEPQVNLQLGSTKSRVAVNTPAGTTTARVNQRSFVPAAAYEVDLWGRLRSAEAAAQLDAAASRGDLDTIAMTLAASVSDVYFRIVEQRAALELNRRQLQVNETFLELVKLRFGQGQASALDVYQQRQQVAASRSQLPLVESALKVFEHQLAELLGLAAGSALPCSLAALPEPPAATPTGIPSDLLKRRPDVRAAELRAAAADYRVAEAIADSYPRFSLSASLPFQASQVASLFDEFVWTIGASLTAPLYDGGLREAEVDRTQAVVEERLAAYGAALLNALREVQDALVEERQHQAYLREVREQLKLGNETLREARNRYIHGLSDYLPVLTALRDVQRLELLELNERRQLLSLRIQLYRALGGSWMRELTPRRPEPPQPPASTP